MLFLQALTLLLIGLKLTGHIAWPWLAVFTPLLIWTVLVTWATYMQQRQQQEAHDFLYNLIQRRNNRDDD